MKYGGIFQVVVADGTLASAGLQLLFGGSGPVPRVLPQLGGSRAPILAVVQHQFPLGNDVQHHEDHANQGREVIETLIRLNLLGLGDQATLEQISQPNLNRNQTSVKLAGHFYE